MQQYIWLLVPQTGTNCPKFGHLLMDYQGSIRQWVGATLENWQGGLGLYPLPRGELSGTFCQRGGEPFIFVTAGHIL